MRILIDVLPMQDILEAKLFDFHPVGRSTVVQKHLCLRRGQEAARRRGRDRPRNGRFPVGDRTGGRARITSDLSLPLRRPGSGARKVGNSRR